MRPRIASDIMNRNIIAVREDMPATELASLLTEEQISGVPVLDATGKLVGVVSMTDLAEMDRDAVEQISGTGDPLRPVRDFGEAVDAEGVRLRIRDSGLRVRDIMTPTAFTIPADTPIPQVARTMVAGRVHRLLVTRDERVVGIVTTLDLLALLAEKNKPPKPPAAGRGRRGARARTMRGGGGSRRAKSRGSRAR
jgi:CBS domain-containing protein